MKRAVRDHLRAVDEARRTATITATLVAGLVPLLWWIAR